MAEGDREKIRLLVDCHVFDGGLQGTTTYLKGIYTELIKEQDKEFFLAASDTGNLKKIFGEAANITYLQYKSHNKFYRLLVDIPRIIKKHGIDYAHFQYVTPPFKYCKYINTVHDVLFMDYPDYFPLSYRIKNRLLFKRSAKQSDIILTVSHYSKEKLEQHFGLKDITITPNAVDPAFFKDYNREAVQQTVKEKFGISNYWLYVSRWEPRKNHHTLLKVFAESESYKKYFLAFAGDVSIPNPEFDKLYASLPAAIQQKVVFLNSVKFNDLLLLVRGASISVYPSIAEGFGIPPLEAAAAGIPSACSDTSAMADFTFLGNMLFDPFSEEDMLQKIETGLAGRLEPKPDRQALEQRYNWKTSAQKLSERIARE